MEGLRPAVAGRALWMMVSDVLGFWGAQGGERRGQGPPFLDLDDGACAL